MHIRLQPAATECPVRVRSPYQPLAFARRPIYRAVSLCNVFAMRYIRNQTCYSAPVDACRRPSNLRRGAQLLGSKAGAPGAAAGRLQPRARPHRPLLLLVLLLLLLLNLTLSLLARLPSLLNAAGRPSDAAAAGDGRPVHRHRRQRRPLGLRRGGPFATSAQAEASRSRPVTLIYGCAALMHHDGDSCKARAVSLLCSAAMVPPSYIR